MRTGPSIGMRPCRANPTANPTVARQPAASIRAHELPARCAAARGRQHVAMAKAHGLAVLALIFGGAGLWFLLAHGNDFTPPANDGPATARRTEAPPDAVAAPRAGSRRSVPMPAFGNGAVEPSATTAAAANQADALQPNLVLHVRDLISKQPIEHFHCTWTAGDDRNRSDADHGEARLRLPPGRGTLLVEAETWQPCSRDDLDLPAPGAEPLLVELFLQHAGPGTGVRLSVVDDLGRPVAQLRVDTFPAVPGNSRPWLTARATSARKASAADGVYDLPALAPGSHVLRLQALDGEGAPRALQCDYLPVELTGSNAIVQSVQLQPGTPLTLALVDAGGQPCNPDELGGVALRLVDAVGSVYPQLWEVVTPQGRVESLDALPAAGDALARDALPFGNYRLEVLVSGELRVTTSLVLRTAEPQRVVVELR